MRFILVPFIALGFGTAAMAADATAYPPCSKTVQDECTSASSAKHHMAVTKTAAHHHMTHHKAAPAKP